MIEFWQELVPISPFKDCRLLPVAPFAYRFICPLLLHHRHSIEFPRHNEYDRDHWKKHL
jgi:hypothetical protein